MSIAIILSVLSISQFQWPMGKAPNHFFPVVLKFENQSFLAIAKLEQIESVAVGMRLE